MSLRQRYTINLPPNDELGGCDDSTNQICKKKGVYPIVSVPGAVGMGVGHFVPLGV